MEKLLGKLGQDTQRIEDSVLIGCSEQHEAWFALDLGLSNSSSMSGTHIIPTGNSQTLGFHMIIKFHKKDLGLEKGYQHSIFKLGHKN